jgi:hypothetical protein
MKKTAHDLKRRTADLRRGRVGTTQDVDVNTWHQRLPLIPAKQPSSFAMTDGQRCGDFKAATALGFRAARRRGSGDS